MFLSPSGFGHALEWREQKGNHFIIRTEHSISDRWARDVLEKAEIYYRTIAEQIGYARYNKFWTWDTRVEIIVYDDRDVFLKETGQPAWSQGGAIHRPLYLEERKIVTYKQDENFLDGLLPHEISHLMLIDFIGWKQEIPLWFNEGVAQLQEKGKKEKAQVLMKALVPRGQYIRLEAMTNLDIRSETDGSKVALFYAQSLSVTDFMISRYGSKAFGLLCRHMRDGRNFEEALKLTYPRDIGTIEELEKKWLSYMKN
jgi:hypothetical protein